jgi:hypothetical protein
MTFLSLTAFGEPISSQIYFSTIDDSFSPATGPTRLFFPAKLNDRWLSLTGESAILFFAAVCKLKRYVRLFFCCGN